MRKILVDVFGSDHPEALLEGVVAAAGTHPDVVFAVAGDETLLRDKLAACAGQVEIIPAASVITNEEDVGQAIVSKRDSSVVRALSRLKEDEEAVEARDGVCNMTDMIVAGGADEGA